MYGRYEFHNEEENSHKFWQCAATNNGMVEIRWGRIGTAGQTQLKPGDKADKLIAAKIRKGYKLVTHFVGGINKITKPPVDKINKTPKLDQNWLAEALDLLANGK